MRRVLADVLWGSAVGLASALVFLAFMGCLAAIAVLAADASFAGVWHLLWAAKWVGPWAIVVGALSGGTQRQLQRRHESRVDATDALDRLSERELLVRASTDD